jgi:hypothetical protein
MGPAGQTVAMTAVLTPIDLKRHAKVRANIDLPGVPAGTPGKVLQVTGLTWRRYRVMFNNGVEAGLLDGRHLVKPKEFVPLDQRTAVVAPVAASGGGAGGEAAAAAEGEGGGAADNAFGVPAHLLERSKKARDRLTAE